MPLVEGAPQVREGVADVLRQCGAHVTAVDSAVAGLAILKRERPDALVSSLSMPDKDGYWLIREVRKLPPDQRGDVPAARKLSSEMRQSASDICESPS